MNGVSRRRAYTLAELAATFAVLGLITVLLAVSTGGSERAGRDAQAQIALEGLVGAQLLRHDTFGSFADDPAVLTGMLAQYEFTTALDPSTSGTEISVTAGDNATGEFFAAAALGDSGACYTVKVYEASVAVDDERRVYLDAEPGACTGSFAVTTGGGDSW